MTKQSLNIIKIVLVVLLILTIVFKLGFIPNAIVAIALIGVVLYDARQGKGK